MKILIIRLSSLGDIVLTQPIGKILKEKYPESAIDFLTKSEYKELPKMFGYVDNVYEWDGKDKIKRILFIKKKRYDLIIDLQAKLNTFLIKSVGRARRTVTYKKKHLLRLLIVKKISSRKIDSTLNLYLSVFDSLKICYEYKLPRLIEPKKKIDFNFESGKKYIAVFPGATHETKRFPLSKTVGFLDKLISKNDLKVILLGSKNEYALAEEIRIATRKECRNLCGKFNLSELVSFINRVDFVVSNDSGPMHIAASLKKKQIALFGATHTKLGFKPLNDNAEVIELNLPCQPCSLHGAKKCPKGHFACMNYISPETVYQKFQTLADKDNRNHSD